MTIEEKRAKLAEKQEQERIKLEQEERIRAAIPEDLRTLPWVIHLSELYGRTVWLRLGYSRYRLTNDPPPPTLETVARIAAAFPEVVTLRKYSDSCTSFRTAAYIDGMPEERTDRADVLRVASFLVKIEPADYSQKLVIEWYSRIAGEVVTFAVEFPLVGEVASRMGIMDLFCKRLDDGTVYQVVRNTYTPDPRIVVLGNSTVRQIKWAAGDRKNPGDHTLYWESGNLDESTCTVLDLVQALRPIVEIRATLPHGETYSVYVNDREVVTGESYMIAHTIGGMVRNGHPDMSECGEVAQGILDALRTDPHVASDDQELYGADAAQIQADRRREDQP